MNNDVSESFGSTDMNEGKLADNTSGLNLIFV